MFAGVETAKKPKEIAKTKDETAKNKKNPECDKTETAKKTGNGDILGNRRQL